MFFYFFVYLIYFNIYHFLKKDGLYILLLDFLDEKII